MPTGLLENVIIPLGLRVLMALLVWIVGRWLARYSRRWLTRSLEKTTLTESLITLIKTLSYYGVLIVAGVLALGILGVPTTALVTAISVVVVILAIALQQSLGNLAATVNILLFKPFETEDIIETGGVMGSVHEIQMFNTILLSSDGKTHVLPNAKIQSAGLANYSQTGQLRLNLNFRISYDSDIDQAKAILMDLFTVDERVLPETPERVLVQKLAGSCVKLPPCP